MVDLTPAIITASAAFLGASIAQIISHWLTIRRETDKYNREVYQKLFAPILLDVFFYMDMKLEFQRTLRENPEERENKLSEKIYKHLADNLIYAGPSLISAFHSAKVSEYTPGEAAFGREFTDGPLFLAVLDDLYDRIRDMKDFGKLTKEKLMAYRTLYVLWLSIMRLFYSSTLAEYTLKATFYFDLERISDKKYKNLLKFIKSLSVANSEINSLTSSGVYHMNRQSTYRQLIRYISQHLITTIEYKNEFIISSDDVYEYIFRGETPYNDRNQEQIST